MEALRRHRTPRTKRSPTPGSIPPPRKDSASSEPPSPGGVGGSKPLYLCRPFADAALVKGNFKTIVMLPKYVDIMEWVAVNSTYCPLPQPSLCSLPLSVRLLHQPQRVLWCYYRVLHAAELSNDVRGPDVCFLLRRAKMFSSYTFFSQLELQLDESRGETNRSVRTDLHRFCDVVHPETPGRRERLPNQIQYAHTQLCSHHMASNTFFAIQARLSIPPFPPLSSTSTASSSVSLLTCIMHTIPRS